MKNEHSRLPKNIKVGRKQIKKTDGPVRRGLQRVSGEVLFVYFVQPGCKDLSPCFRVMVFRYPETNPPVKGVALSSLIV